MSISIETLKEAISLKEKITALETRLSKILGGGEVPTPFFKPEPAKRRRRKMSASARAKIAAAQRARWAKLKGTKTKNDAAARKRILSSGQPPFKII